MEKGKYVRKSKESERKMSSQGQNVNEAHHGKFYDEDSRKNSAALLIFEKTVIRDGARSVVMSSTFQEK